LAGQVSIVAAKYVSMVQNVDISIVTTTCLL